ncbi:MAG: cofactor-independent phosphoglycerate mutase [Armatimonadota bacterium]|nr:MAG: cofactor-independent phosphoglycerate mutase [Armatimonadota bacterium]
MRYVLLIPDGAADEPRDELDGRTPLAAAEMPEMDALAAQGQVGLVRTVPPEIDVPGSDVACLSLLGYDPRRYYTGRGPLEAVSMGVDLGPADVAFRCNLVTCGDDMTMLDYSAGEIETPLAHQLMETVSDELGTPELCFFPGISYRHLLVWRDGPADAHMTPPHDIMGQPIEKHLPEGDGAERLIQLIHDSHELLNGLEVNQRLRDAGKHPANMIWPWGQGRLMRLPAFALRWGVPGFAVAAVDLVRGIAKAAGLSAPEIPGATGNLDTDFDAKGRAAVAALERYGFVLVHVEASDEASHQGDVEKKVWALEQFDREVVGQVAAALGRFKESRVLIVPDHATPIAVRTHSKDPVPFLLAGTGIAPDSADRFTEALATDSGVLVEEGHHLIERLLG